MARQDIDIGVEGNDGTGDSIRESFRKVNENFTEIYAVFGVEGSLSFLSLGDTPNEFENNKILTTNAAGTAVIFSSITSSDGTIGIDVISTPGEIDLSVASIQIADDTTSPTLGQHLSAANFGIAGVKISAAAAQAINDQPGRSTSYTIDDLVITKGYADRRYVTSGLPIRVAAEPANTDAFVLTIDSYSGDGHLVFTSGHGYDSGANGTAFVFNAEDSDPTGLTSGTTYYIRYETDTELSMFTNREDAQQESDTDADVDKIGVSGSIAVDDVHTITDAGYDVTLSGNFLSDVAMPRESVTRRQGDTMEGPLYLADHPGDLAGAGTPNGTEDLQAATKYYVDNTAYSSPEVLFVSTAGDDTMSGVPAGKEGTADTYAYRTINAAARRAAELINTAPEEPGPYFQTLSFGATTTSAGTAATVISAAVETAINVDTRSIIQNNRSYLIKEITGYLAFTYPDFAYNVDTCERDLGLVLDAVTFDATRGNTANYLSRTAAERYYSSVSGRIAITSQLERTDDAFAKTLEIAQAVLQNQLFNPKVVTAISKKSGDTPASVTTSTAHGLANGNQVIFQDVSGMTEIEDEIIYVKVTGSGTFELFSDEALETAYDNSAYTNFVNDGSAKIGLRYQDKLSQDTTVSPLSDTDNGYVAITQNFGLIRNIIRNGPDSPTAADVAFGNRYELDITNSTAGQLDQTDPDNVDALPGKVIVGKRSGAIGRIITYTQDTDSTTFYLQPLEAKDFDPTEELEMGNFVKAKQVVIRVESGIYEEDYPIKLTKNVSLKGDEFRRVIIRPKRRVSQSVYANTYFYRDKEFDGITLLTTGTPFTNQVGEVQGYFGYHYLTDNTKPINVGASVTNAGGYLTAANILELNKRFIQTEVGEYVDATYPLLFSSESRTKCERDVGLIVDAIISDLEKGGTEGVLESQGEYYTGALSPGTEAETEDAIDYISTLAGDLLTGTAPSTIRGSVAVDLDGGIAETTWASGTSYTQGDFVKKVVGADTFYYKALVTHVSEATDEDTDIASDDYLKITNTTRWVEVPGSVEVVGDLVDVVNFAFDADYNPPKRNDADGVDVFLMDDATIVRNVTVQGHGGFMCVLDPTGQILTKSPYIQTASCFSRSRNAKAFSGGMFVDAFAGNIPMRIQQNSGNYTDGAGTVALDAFTLYVESQDVGGEDQGLKLRLPELPAPFYFEGQRYQVNAISNYDSGTGRAVIYLDPGSNNGVGWNKAGADDIGDPGHDNADVIQDIFLQTAGNRSILGNDFTQINDLGYGLVTTNGAFSEMVSMFTYYCHAAYYAANGSEIRSLNGSNGYGNFGLVAEGADPNEIPDEVTTLRNMVQPIKAFTYGSFTNAFEDTTITVYDFKEAPMSNSNIYIDHGGLTGPLNYRISRVENLSDPNNDGSIGAAGAIVVTGVEIIDNSSITGSVPAGTATYQNVTQKSTSGSGAGAEFSVALSGGSATFTISNTGAGYAAADTITISGADIGGSNVTNDLTIDVSSVFQNTPGTYIDAGSTGSITGATVANPVVITSNGHGLSNGDEVKITSVTGMIELNGERYFVGNVATNTFELYSNRSLTNTVNGSQFTAYSSGGTWTQPAEIGNQVFRLTIQEAGSNIDFFANLQDTVNHDTFVEYRQSENFVFTGVANPGTITERPSTAVNFDESNLTTYRSTGFSQSDDQSQELGSDEIKATFDAGFDNVVLQVDYANRNTVDPDNGAKTLGGTIGDTKIAVEKIDRLTTETRIVQDATDASSQTILVPGDVGYTGGMIFVYEGKTFQVIDYQPVSYGDITAVTQTDPAVVTSAGHGLTNGTEIEIRQVAGMTNLNGNIFYVGNAATNTFELFTDDGLSNALDASAYSAYVSGGQWVLTNSVWYIEVQDYQTDGADWDITGTSANLGIKTAFASVRDLYLGIVAGTTAEITIAISLLRATGHDFTQIGTGGFNTSNYPNVLLGQPLQSKAGAYSDEDNATKAQVWERRKGRCFFISSDEDGFFRVGKYFVVDQSTGSITFAGEVGISRAASLGFKDGVTISEFSNDELFTDLSDTAVPTEKAIANYVSRRLGHNGSIQLTGSSRFEPGFMALDGSTKMEAGLNMNSNKITNLLDPTSDNDAVTKDFLDQAVSNYDELDDLRNVTIHDRAGSGDEQKQVLVPTGYKRLIIRPTVGTIVATDVLADGSSTATVIATETRFDKVLNENVQIITYDLLTGSGFNTALTPVYVTSPGTKAGVPLENPVDEFTNAKEATTSDINITVNRAASDTTIDLQIEAGAILNSDVNADAELAQSKLMMNRAKPLSSSSGLFGTDGDGGGNGEGDSDGTGRTGQSSRGLAAFEGGVFAEDVELTLDDFISANAGDVIIQGSNRGYVVSSVSSSLTVVVRTDDTFTVAATAVQKAIVTSGVEGTPANFLDGGSGTVAITAVKRSGYISLYDRGLDYSKLPNMTGGNTGDAYGGSVIGRATDDSGAAEAVPFTTVIDQGKGLSDDDFTTERAYGSPVNDPGLALIQYGTAGGGTYAYTDIAYDNTGNSLVKRTNTGAVHVGSLIVGSDPSYITLTESGGTTITMKTPGQGTIFSASGASKPTINTGGVIRVGDIGAYSESSLHEGSDFGTVGGAESSPGAGDATTETSALAARWIYSSFIEAPGEKDATGTGIGIGAGIGKSLGGADVIAFVTGGNVEARVTTTGIETDDIRSISTNANLILSGNGTGIVEISDSLDVDAIESRSTNTNLSLSANGTGQVYISGTGALKISVGTTAERPGTAAGTTAAQGMVRYNTSDSTFEGYDGSAWGSLGGVKDVDQDTYIEAEDTADEDTLRFYTAGVERLTIASGGGVTVASTDALTVRTITTGAAATTGTITGTWSLGASSKFEATYADLAEYYEADAEYEEGTVLVFGGDKEITQSAEHRSRRVAGVVSINPAYTMNAECPGIATAVALQGRVPCKVIGKVAKGDMLVASAIPGHAIVDNDPKVGTVIGKAVGEKLDDSKGIVEVVVGRV